MADQQERDIPLSVKLARVAHEHVENEKMRHDVGLALAAAVESHLSFSQPSSVAMTKASGELKSLTGLLQGIISDMEESDERTRLTYIVPLLYKLIADLQSSPTAANAFRLAEDLTNKVMGRLKLDGLLNDLTERAVKITWYEMKNDIEAVLKRSRSTPVIFMGIDPLNIVKNPSLPMIPDSWRYGFYHSDAGLHFGARDNGPLVAWDAIKGLVASPQEASSLSDSVSTMVGKEASKQGELPSRGQFHDLAWNLYREKLMHDTMLKNVSIHTMRAVFDACYDALPTLSASPSDADKRDGGDK